MWVAAQNNGRLNVLDFGGALGSSYFQHKAFFKNFPEIYWNVVEQEHYIKAGKKHIQDDQLRFYSSIDECVLDNDINIVLLSSVLQYLEKPKDILTMLLKLKPSCIIIDRTFYNYVSNKDFISRQIVPKSIYNLSLPCHIFSEKDQEDIFKLYSYEILATQVTVNHQSSNIFEKGYIWKI